MITDGGQGQLGDRAGIAERTVENRDAMAGGSVEIDLVGADTETAQRQQAWRGFKGSCSHLGARTNAGNPGIGEGGVQGRGLERRGMTFNVQSRGQQGRIGHRVEIFKQDGGIGHRALPGLWRQTRRISLHRNIPRRIFARM